MEVPTPVEGVIKKINVDIGDKVSAGNIFLEVETSTSSLPISEKEISSPDAEVPAEGDTHKNDGATPNESQPVTQSKFNVYAGPAVRKLAREFGIDLNLIQPTGPKGRILKLIYIDLLRGGCLDKNLQALNSISQMLIILSGAR